MLAIRLSCMVDIEDEYGSMVVWGSWCVTIIVVVVCIGTTI